MPGLDFETETMAEFEPEAETEAEKAFPSFGADVEPGLEALMFPVSAYGTNLRL
jgi:hypothetical protein